jgi:hypothetical protein
LREPVVKDNHAHLPGDKDASQVQRTLHGMIVNTMPKDIPLLDPVDIGVSPYCIQYTQIRVEIVSFMSDTQNFGSGTRV